MTPMKASKECKIVDRLPEFKTVSKSTRASFWSLTHPSSKMQMHIGLFQCLIDSTQFLYNLILRSFLWSSIILLLYLLLQSNKPEKHKLLRDAPIVGKKWQWEPLFLTRYRYILSGRSVTKEGWDKVSNQISFEHLETNMSSPPSPSGHLCI